MYSILNSCIIFIVSVNSVRKRFGAGKHIRLCLTFNYQHGNYSFLLSTMYFWMGLPKYVFNKNAGFALEELRLSSLQSSSIFCTSIFQPCFVYPCGLCLFESSYWITCTWLLTNSMLFLYNIRITTVTQAAFEFRYLMHSGFPLKNYWHDMMCHFSICILIHTTIKQERSLRESLLKPIPAFPSFLG